MRNDIDTVIDDLSAVDLEMTELKKQKTLLETELAALTQKEIDEQLSQNDYGTGTATIKGEKYIIKAVVPKKVKWDQAKLLDLHDRIIAAGDDPRVYMTCEFKVSETAFGKWPTEIQDAFTDCRTVEHGKTSFKFEEKK